MTQKTSLLKYVMSLMLIMLGFASQAQTPTYDMYITNQSQVDSKTYQFDVYVLRTGANALEMAGIQLGIGMDTSITNGGTLSFSFVTGSSELVAAQVPQTFIVGSAFYTVNNVVYRCLSQTARTGPGAGNGTVISATKTGCTTPGTRIGTYRLSNTRDFKSASSAKHIFNVTAGAQRTVTALTCYVSGVNTTATGTLYNYNTQGSCDQNLSLNGCAVSAGVSTNAVVCYGQSTGSATVTLSGLGSSSTGTYKLDGGASVAYSSNPFTVSGLSAGSHTIAVTTTGLCEASTGSFTVNGPAGPSTSSTTRSECTSFLWNGTTYTASGVYTFNTTSGAGCDSTATLNLTIRNKTTSSSSASVCPSALPYQWNGGSYTASGVYTYHTTNAAGCDSTVTLNLTVKSNSSSSSSASVCPSALPYQWNSGSYTASGVYTYHTTNAAGCDSTVTLNLTVKSNSSSSSDASVCPSALPYQWNGGSYTASGVYTYHTTNAAGCDSTVTLNLTVKSNSSSSSSATVCAASLPYSWNNGSYTASGVYTYNTTNAAGCDSTVTLNLTVAQSASSQTPVSVCASALPYSWNGSNYTASGTYTFNTATTNGCDSVATLVLTVNASSSSTTIASACVSAGAYSWNGVSYTASGVYTYSTTNAAGCDSTAILNLSVTSTIPTVSPAITQVLVSNLCGARTYRYSAATTANATGYNWILPTSVGGISGVTLDSGFATSSRVILVTYASNAAALSTDSIKVRAYSGCGFTAYKAAKLSNALLTVPAAPTAITITPLITNVCGSRVYRYSVPALPAGTATTGAATGYVWEFVGSLSEYATIDSGDVNSQKIVVSYTSNAAAATGDSIKFYYTSGCGNSLTKAAKLSNTALKEPAAATAVTITAIQTNVCGARRYRYSAPNLPVATTTTGAATGYVWDFVGSLASTMTIDSGDLNSQRFTVTFTSNGASATGDSVRMYYTSDCGNSLRKTAKLSNTSLLAPAAAAATGVTITPIQTNVCSIRKYRYSAPALPAATTTTGAASGYVWDVIGSLASTMTIDSGDLYSQRFTVTFTSNAASAAGDSVRVLYTTAGCGNSARRAVKLSNTLLSAPAAATAVTITPIQTTVCSARKYRYSAPNLPAATTSTGAANGYVWDFVGSLASTMTIDSGNVNSQAFTVTFTSNAAAANVDSVRVLYTTAGCGNSARKGAKLANTLLGAPAAPASITIATKSDVCYARTYRYIAPAPLPGATTSAGAASGYLWSAPTGTVGSTGTIDSGSVTSRIITVTYTSNAAAGLDSIRLQYTSAGCGTSAPKAQKLSNLIKTGCVPPITKTTSRVPNSSPASMEVKVYPNPTTTQFNVQVKSSGTEEAVVRVLDVTGRFIKRVKVSSNSNVNLGSDLKAGAYMLEVKQGKEVKTVRVMKF